MRAALRPVPAAPRPRQAVLRPKPAAPRERPATDWGRSARRRLPSEPDRSTATRKSPCLHGGGFFVPRVGTEGIKFLQASTLHSCGSLAIQRRSEERRVGKEGR